MKKILIALLLPCALFAQTHIYRSVQPGVTAAIGTGTGTLTISGSTATFSVSQPDSIGVGDAIQYDSDGNGSIDAICFIHGRTSGTEYTVKNAAGAEPTAVAGDEDWDIFRAYISWANMEAGTENTGIDDGVENFDGGNRDIVTATEIWNVAFYPGVDSAGIDFDGWITNPTYYVNFFSPYLPTHVGETQRHSGKLTLRCYRIIGNLGTGNVFEHTGSAGTSFGLKIDGLQFVKPAGAGAAISLSKSETNGREWVSNCIIIDIGHSTNTTRALFIVNGSTRVSYVWNNIIEAGTNSCGIELGANGGTSYQYNNTVASGFECFTVNATGATVIAKNNIAHDLQTAQTFNGWQGTFHENSNYNTTSDNSDAPGENSLQNVSFAFTNVTDGDYHLTAADAALAIGTDLSGDANLSFSTDIDNDTRTTWNMGADEYIAVGGRKRKKPIWWSEYHEKDFIDWLLALR